MRSLESSVKSLFWQSMLRGVQALTSMRSSKSSEKSLFWQLLCMLVLASCLLVCSVVVMVPIAGEESSMNDTTP